MNAKDAVVKRIQILRSKRGIAVNAFVNVCGVSPSPIYGMLNKKILDSGVVSTQKICNGLEVSVWEPSNDFIF